MCTWLFAEECDVTKSHFENLDKYRTVLLLHESRNFMTKVYKDLLWEIYVCICYAEVQQLNIYTLYICSASQIHDFKW